MIDHSQQVIEVLATPPVDSEQPIIKWKPVQKPGDASKTSSPTHQSKNIDGQVKTLAVTLSLWCNESLSVADLVAPPPPSPPPPKKRADYVFLNPILYQNALNKAQIAGESLKNPESFQGPWAGRPWTPAIGDLRLCARDVRAHTQYFAPPPPPPPPRSTDN